MEATHVWHGHRVRLIGLPRWVPGGLLQDVANVGGDLDGLHYAVVREQLRPLSDDRSELRHRLAKAGR